MGVVLYEVRSRLSDRLPKCALLLDIDVIANDIELFRCRIARWAGAPNANGTRPADPSILTSHLITH